MPGTVSEVSATLVASTMRRPRARREHALLLLRPTAARTAAGSRRRARTAAARGRARSRSAGLADLALAGQEHEDVARALAPQVLGRGDDRLLELLLVVGLLARRSLQRPVADLDRIRAARDLDHRRRRSPSVPKCRAKRSASSVADVTITLRSGRRGSSCFR